MLLSNLSIRRPVLAAVMALILVTLGVFSYRRLAIDMFPDIDFAIVTVVTEYPGASPETVEREVSRRIEEVVNPIPGVKHIQSNSVSGISSVTIEFSLGVRGTDAVQDVRAAVVSIRDELPAGIHEPVVQKFSMNSIPIVSLAVQSEKLASRELSVIADRKIKRRLENLPGVGRVNLVGEAKREVMILADPTVLESIGLGMEELVNGLSTEATNTPLGIIRSGNEEFPLRVVGKPELVKGYASMAIARRGDHQVTLGEVARVVDGIEEQTSLAFVNGIPAVGVDILKQSKTNTVALADNVLREVGLLKKELPDVRIRVVRDESASIREAVRDVQITLVLGGLLAVLVVSCYLNSWRSTIITGVTLPISVISSFVIMHAFGMTLNTMTLMALSLAIGLLIDDAIVVRENIVRHMELGEDHLTAARKGTEEIGLAVTATTLSIIAVFIPVAFMKGVVGQFFFDFGITIAGAVLVSLFVSFTLDPMLSSRWKDPDIGERGGARGIRLAFSRFNEKFDHLAGKYKGVIRWSLDHRMVVLGLAIAAFVGGIGLFAVMDKEFMPGWDQGEFQIKFSTSPTASIEETKDRLNALLRAIGDIPEIELTYAGIGAQEGSSVRDALVYVKLKKKSERRRHQKEVLSDVRSRIVRIPGIKSSVEVLDISGNTQKALQVAIRGDDIRKLKSYADAIKGKLYRVPGIVDLGSTMEEDMPEYQVIVDRRRAASVGLGSEDIIRTMGTLVGGSVVATFEDEEGEAVNVRLRLPAPLRKEIGQMGNLRIAVMQPDGTPALVPVSDIASFRMAVSPSEITRQDLSRQILISANLDKLPMGRAIEEVYKAIREINMEPGYKLFLLGDTEAMGETFGYIVEALLLAVIFVYLLLAAQFESFIDPLSIMFSLPLSIVGMAAMLFITGDSINLISLIGLIMLMGLVTKNAILLVDYTNVLRQRGFDRRDAIIEAGHTRLRPIMMTTLAMIFGMLPLALALGQGAEMRAPLGRAVIGGLITSTLLTLVVVPVTYTFLDDLCAWFRKKRRA
jgi:HAE1 family hydrophobic/amphiphilic exporter-1